MKQATTCGTALIVIDVQNDLVDRAGKALHEGFADVVAQRGIIPKIRRVLDAVRATGVPAVFIRVGFRADYGDAISQSARLARLKQKHALITGTWGLAARPRTTMRPSRAGRPVRRALLLFPQ